MTQPVWERTVSSYFFSRSFDHAGWELIYQLYCISEPTFPCYRARADDASTMAPSSSRCTIEMHFLQETARYRVHFLFQAAVALILSTTLSKSGKIESLCPCEVLSSPENRNKSAGAK